CDVKKISSPLRAIAGLESEAALLSSLTLTGRLKEPSEDRVVVQRSLSPRPPGRLLMKYSVVSPLVSSSNSVGPSSKPGEFTRQPRLTGGSHPKSSRLSLRNDTHKSRPPHPPGRSLPKKIRCPSGSNAGANSDAGLLSASTATGAPHSDSPSRRCDT